MKKIVILFVIFLSSYNISYGQFYSKPDCSRVPFFEDIITVGKCKLNVYKAETYAQKLCGMLNFTDKTFAKDAMIFTGNENRIESYTFHTMNMQMTIRIMGIVKQKDGTYRVYDNDAKYSPPGISSVTIYGNAVLETSEAKFKKLKNCMITKG